MSDTIRDAVRTELATILAGYTDAWEYKETVNAAEDPDVSDPYVTLQFSGGNETPAWFGDPGNNGWRTYGLVYVDLVAPTGHGHAEGEALARAIIDGFRNRRFQTSDSLDCRVLSVNPLGGGEDDRAFWRESIALEIRVFSIG